VGKKGKILQAVCVCRYPEVHAALLRIRRDKEGRVSVGSAEEVQRALLAAHRTSHPTAHTRASRGSREGGTREGGTRHWGATLLEFLHTFTAPGLAMQQLEEVIG
jgi:hypothetical protein